jgi:AraC-like DNA-binding protein
MGFRTEPLLERRPVFHSRDVDETRAWLRGKEFRFDPLGRQAGQPDVRLNGVYLPSGYLGYLQYGVKACIRAAPARDDYWVQLPIRGALDAIFGNNTIACSPRRAVVLSPTRGDYYLMRSDADGARVHICINRDAILGQLAALLGEPVDRPIEFDPVLSLTSGYGRILAGYLLMAIADFEQPGAILHNSIAVTSFEQFIITGLLLAHRHTCSERLRRRQSPISPRDIKRAVDYMESNLDRPITLLDIVEVSGVSGRTLFKHFRDWRGVSPMRYLRNARFQRARDQLKGAEPGATVTEIAMGLGFSHMGRFAVEYRRRFGESPSETLSPVTASPARRKVSST